MDIESTLMRDEMSVYAFSELWNGRLYNWLKVRYNDRNNVIEKIINQCNNRADEISSIVKGVFDEQNTEDDYVVLHPEIGYIKFAKLYFSMKISDIDIECNCKIRINPCLKDDPNDDSHYSKIWCIIETSHPISSKINKEFYKISEQTSNKIIDVVADIYTKEIKGGAKPIHCITIKNFGKTDPHIEKLMLASSQISDVYAVLEDKVSRNALVDVVQNVLCEDIADDLLSELRHFGTDTKKFRIVENKDVKGLLAVYFDTKKTTLSTLFNTNNVAVPHNIIREIVIDLTHRL